MSNAKRSFWCFKKQRNLTHCYPNIGRVCNIHPCGPLVVHEKRLLEDRGIKAEMEEEEEPKPCPHCGKLLNYHYHKGIINYHYFSCSSGFCGYSYRTTTTHLEDAVKAVNKREGEE